MSSYLNYYLEIKSFEGNEVIRRFNVTDKSKSYRERCERGMNINLNHDKFYTHLNETTDVLPEIE